MGGNEELQNNSLEEWILVYNKNTFENYIYLLTMIWMKRLMQGAISILQIFIVVIDMFHWYQR